MQKASLPFPKKDEIRYSATATARFCVPAPLETNKNVQGGCSDGKKYYYQAFIHRDNDSKQEQNEVRKAHFYISVRVFF